MCLPRRRDDEELNSARGAKRPRTEPRSPGVFFLEPSGCAERFLGGACYTQYGGPAILTAVLLASLTIVGPGDGQGADLEFHLQTRKPADNVIAVKEPKRTVLLVTSPGGIGAATLLLKAGQWPENVTLRFQYDKNKGFGNLENFHLSTDRVKVEGDLKSSGKFRFCFLDSKRTPIVIEPGKREAAGSLLVLVESKGGALELTLPACLLIGSTRIDLHWIDAYRN